MAWYFPWEEGFLTVKFIKQFGIILCISFVGEVLNHLIPLPVPASIYGVALMFLCLELRIIPLHAVKETGVFLIEIMPLMFIPAAVGLLDSWEVIRPAWVQYLVITVVSTFAVMIAAGRVTQAVIRRKTRQAVKRNG